MQYIDSAPTEDIRLQLIRTLMEVCEGKMYVEAESARLHLRLCKILEDQGDLTGACAAIQDVHVETYGSIGKLEKCEYILEQIRVNLQLKDYVRALIQSRKMNRKILDEPEQRAVKVAFYAIMVQYYVAVDMNTWEISLCFSKMMEAVASSASSPAESSSANEQDQEHQHEQYLCATIAFLLASKRTKEWSALMHSLISRREFDESLASQRSSALQGCAVALRLFSATEIMAYPFEGLSTMQTLCSASLTQVGVSADLVESAAKDYAIKLRLRVIQHNVRVASTYYTRVRFARLAQLTGLSDRELEHELTEMSSAGDVVVKIDRPRGIVVFGKPKSVDAMLSEWTGDIDRMLTLMDSTCHLVNRELLVHNIS